MRDFKKQKNENTVFSVFGSFMGGFGFRDPSRTNQGEKLLLIFQYELILTTLIL
jgi:hypothetical protein